MDSTFWGSNWLAFVSAVSISIIIVLILGVVWLFPGLQ